jgi:hypothetical protein
MDHASFKNKTHLSVQKLQFSGPWDFVGGRNNAL